MSIFERVDAWFHVSDKRSSIGTELRGGFVSFVSTAYLLLLIPHLLISAIQPIAEFRETSNNQSNDNAQLITSIPDPQSQLNVVASVSICVIVATLLSAIFTNSPLVLVPGLGLTAFFAVVSSTTSIAHAIACAFLSSLLISITSFLGINSELSRFIPRNLKVASMVGLGLFVSLTGLLMAGIVVVSPHGLTLGEMIDNPSKIIIAFSGFIVITSLMYHRVSGGMLFGIIIATVMYYLFAWRLPALEQFAFPSVAPLSNTTLMTSFRSLTPNSFWTIISFYLIQLFDVTTMIHTCSSRSYMSLRDNDAHTFERRIYLITGISSMFSALYGCPPLIIAVESVLSIKGGSKTGLSALFAASLFALCMPIASFLAIIPPIATASCSIVVGSFLVAECGRVPWLHPISSLPAFITIVLIPFSGSVAVGIVAGYVTHIALCLSTGHPVNAWQHEEDVSLEGEQVSDAELSDDEEQERLTVSTDDYDPVLSQIPGRYGATSDEIYSPRKADEIEGSHF